MFLLFMLNYTLFPSLIIGFMFLLCMLRGLNVEARSFVALANLKGS